MRQNPLLTFSLAIYITRHDKSPQSKFCTTFKSTIYIWRKGVTA